MKEKFKTISILFLCLLLFVLVWCGSDKTDYNKNPPTYQEYYDYLTERYNYYFNNSDLDTNYDVFLDNFTYDGSYDEFITVYNDDYGQLKRNLEAFKSDLENNVIKGNDEVDKYNQEMITATDKAIIAVDDYIGSFGEKDKDYATLSKDEVVKGLRSLTLDAHNARLDLKNLYDDAKDKLGIK